MKKVFLSMLLILALSLSFFHIASAEDVFGLEYRVDKCREYITLREEPRTSAGEITRVPLGATVTAFTEAENGVICELRSSVHNIQPIAVKYGGGGHAKACGCTVADKETVMALLADLDEIGGNRE